MSMLTCPICGYVYPINETDTKAHPCPLCSGGWDVWELQIASIPTPEIQEQIASWLGRLPTPSVLEIAATQNGIKIYLYAPPNAAQGTAKAWAAMTHQQSRWIPVDDRILSFSPAYALRTEDPVPSMTFTEGDSFLAIGGQLLSQALPDRETSLRLWLLGQDKRTQERIRALSAYFYGTESGVSDSHAPNPWGLRLTLLRVALGVGMGIAGISAGGYGAGWFPPAGALVGTLGGSILFVASAMGIMQWMRWRSVPKEVLELRASDVLLKTAFVLQSPRPEAISLLTGTSDWKPIQTEWPGIHTFAMPLPASEISPLITPPQAGEGSGIIDQDVRQDIPTPPPSRTLVEAPFKIGIATATGESIGVDPDGHGLAVGGSRTGKSSFVNVLLKQLIQRGEDAPGIFLVDPHVGLTDSFLQAIDNLPPALRSEGIKRLRIITPDQPEVVPVNLLAIPEFTWAGNAIVQIGQRIWDDYWGPRMQAALLGLFRLAHTHNMHNPDERMGFLHVVFAAFDPDWRHRMMAYLDPVDRMGTLALDALLGQLSEKYGNWSQGWVTEVISPVLSKAMALELSPW
ncbi:MAG: hypothetical protein KJ638_07335, partial [Chloroflexi bacterium]|nr:hypothetical protein [Chloroflexota bacterium]